jgi:hypothetical protein
MAKQLHVEEYLKRYQKEAEVIGLKVTQEEMIKVWVGMAIVQNWLNDQEKPTTKERGRGNG